MTDFYFNRITGSSAGDRLKGNKDGSSGANREVTLVIQPRDDGGSVGVVS